MLPTNYNLPVLRNKPARGRRYGRCSPRYMAAVHKWRFHFYGVILNNVLRNGSTLELPFDFAPYEKFMEGFKVEYRDINDLPQEFLAELREAGEVNEGWNYIQDGVVYIFYDPTVSRERQRFTIAHEWGHVIQKLDEDFRMDMEAIPDATERTAIIESVANHMASFYLVPHPLLNREVRNIVPVTPNEDALVRKLAARFAVSPIFSAISFSNSRPRFQLR